MCVLSLLLVFSAPCWIQCLSGPFGPPYPVTGSWFKDRFTRTEWNITLRDFAKQGGDTVLLRAPAVVEISYDDFLQDPNFKWCGNYRKLPNVPNGNCLKTAVDDLKEFGITIKSVMTYQYEEDFAPKAMIRCPKYDKRIVSDRIYYRLVLPLVQNSTKEVCDLNGSDVVLVFTTFAGIDPHELLLDTASEYKMSVYFGLPLPPYTYADNNAGRVPDYLIGPYFEFLQRILEDHSIRFGKNNKTMKTLKGYFWSADVMLLDTHSDIASNGSMTYVELFQQIRMKVKEHNKLFGFPTFIQANKFERSSNINDYVTAFTLLATGNCADIISVKDGRGSGFGALYWYTQKHVAIETVDQGLYALLSYYYPTIMLNQTLKTFEDVFSFSINEIMSSLADARDQMAATGYPVDVWLNIEAYDALHDDPCLPVDTAGSGQDRMLNRVTKSRIDRVLTHSGAFTQKIVSEAWDPGFTCSTKNKTTPLRNEIFADMSRPVISHCSFHSTLNRSVVVIGYNLDGETQGFTIDWPRFNGQREVTHVNGYYFELDWGIQHHRVPSLVYIQMYDPYDIVDLAEKGYVKVTANSGIHACVFQYDFSGSGEKTNSRREVTKKNYRVVSKPVYRIYGQDLPFH